MENDDTLEVHINHSACLSNIHETYTFIKQKDNLFLTTYSEIDSYEKNSQTLPKLVYQIKSKDSLSFENYFKFLKKEDKPKKQYGSPLVIIYYKNKSQTKSFNDDGLQDKFNKLEKLLLIREKLYPTDTFFNIPEPPPPPKKKS